MKFLNATMRAALLGSIWGLSALMITLAGCEIREADCLTTNGEDCPEDTPNQPSNNEQNEENSSNSTHDEDPNPAEESPQNNHQPDASRQYDADAPHHEDEGRVYTLGCAENHNQVPSTQSTLRDDGALATLPINTWQEDMKACNTYSLTRTSGYQYLIVLVPVRNEASLENWLHNSSVGNQTPATDVTTPHPDTLAYLYTSTDLGVPKIYALVWTGRFILYVEWQFRPGTSPEELLTRAKEEHLVFTIPDDLRDLITRIH